VRSLVESNSRVESVGEFRHESLEALATQSVMVCSYSKSVVYGYHKINIEDLYRAYFERSFDSVAYITLG